jgi:Uri superfamily endonuclease
MAGRPKGHKLSEETKRKISETMTGRKQSEEVRKKIGQAVKTKHNLKTSPPIEVLMKTDLSKMTKGKSKKGYVILYIPNENPGQKQYQIREHVAIIEKELGRKLVKGEEIHHFGEKDDNRRHMIHLCKDREEHSALDRLKKRMMELSSVIVFKDIKPEEIVKKAMEEN